MTGRLYQLISTSNHHILHLLLMSLVATPTVTDGETSRPITARYDYNSSTVDVSALYNSENVTNLHHYNYIINHPQLCLSNDSVTIRLLMMIVSAPNQFQSRSAIRGSWGLTANGRTVKRLFVMGRPADATTEQTQIVRENDKFGDILQGDFVDSYKNLTLKSIMIVEWATRYCPRAEFLLKIDDDCFLNPENLFGIMRDVKADEPMIVGLIFQNAEPYRNPAHKNYVSEEEYPFYVYPDFASGPAYLYTRVTYPVIYRTALRTRYLPLEDVFLNGVCARVAGIPSRNEAGFSMIGKLTACNIARSAVTYHRLSQHSQFHALWWVIHDTRLDYCDKKQLKKVKRINRLMKGGRFKK